MKKRNGLKIAFVLFLIVFIVGKVRKENSPDPVAGKRNTGQRSSKPQKQPITQSSAAVDNATLFKVVSEREYHITPDAKGRLQSPNRKQNLRAYYKPGVLTVENRQSDENKDFSLQITNNGVYADGKKLYTCNTNAKEEVSSNELKIKHEDFTEEFVNQKEGIRQNFIIEKAPSGVKRLAVHLGVNGLDVEDRGNHELRFFSKDHDQRQLRLIYNDIHCWDANGKVLESSLAYRGEEIVLEVDARHAAFPVTIDPIISNGNPNNAATTVESNQNTAGLGCSVASAGDVNGDGYSDIVVGAYNYDNGQVNEGAAFVFHGSSSGVSNVPAIVLEGNQPGVNFGFSVSGATDVNKDGFSDIIIGAPKYNHGEAEEGVALIYYGSAAGISQSSSTLIEQNQPLSNFGYSVSSGGDINGDGYSDVLVGAPFFDQGEANEGLVFAYYGSSVGISSASFTSIESNKADAVLGFSVACAGDVNADGISDVIVGAIGYKNAMASNTTGAALVYHGSGAAGLIYSTTLWAISSSQMGFSVASAGDVDGDGYSDVIVGANKYREDDGAAFVFKGSALGINAASSTTLTIADAGIGNSVACAGDVNGDGYSDVIVGAPNYTSGQNKEGAALVYHGSLSGTKTLATSILEADQADANMGFSVASAGDVNGDGYSDVITGAYTYDKGHADEGAAFVFHGSASPNSTTIKLFLEMNQPDAAFGFSVSSAGDVNGDGYSDVIVGAPLFDQGEENEGAAFVFHGSISGVMAFGGSIEGNQKDANMGFSVGCAGDMNGDGYTDVIVGAPYYDNGEAKEGVAFVLKGSSNGVSFGWWQLILEANQADAAYGYSVAGAGDVNGDGYGDVIVGAMLYDDNQPDEGAVFVYQGSAQGVNPAPGKTISSGQTFSAMGYAVNGAGDINGDGYSDIVVSAPLYTKTLTEEGMVSVYYGSQSGIDYNSPLTFLGEQLGAGLGSALGSAGDVNGDGYGDVVIGAYRYFNGQLEEGAVLVYQGTSAGLDLGSVRILDSNQTGSWWGAASASAGDVNGDGYSDVIVGARFYDLGQGKTGAVFVYPGSSSGISSISTGTISLAGQVGATFGISVSSAGDVNGDGYGDVIIGAGQYSNGQNKEGGAFIYLGNQGSAIGTRNNLVLYNADLNTLIEHSSLSKADFGMGLQEKSFLGRTNGKLVWESRKQGDSFSNVPITNSTQFTAQQGTYTDLGIGTTELKGVVTKLGKATKVRARTKYDPVTAITGQMYSPWRYVSAFSAGWSLNESTPLPVTLVNFSAKRIEAQAHLEWVTSIEENSKNFEIQRSTNGKDWKSIGEVPARIDSKVASVYSFVDGEPETGDNLYRLKMIDQDDTYAFSSIQVVVFDENAGKQSISVYPNPSVQKIRIHGNPKGIGGMQLMNSVGQVAFETTGFVQEINVESLPAGLYVLVVTYADGTRDSHKVAVRKD